MVPEAPLEKLEGMYSPSSWSVVGIRVNDDALPTRHNLMNTHINVRIMLQ